ncbi:hypothetical protein J7K93_02370 [bacterium]|nr:hypothetical protein [bacterium]
MKRKILLMSAASLLYSIFCLCTDPVSSDKSKVIKTLVQGKLNAGQYSVFWDGKDEKNNFVEPGTYLVWLTARSFTYEIRMTALTGGAGSNDSTTVPIYGDWGLTELLQNHPDPFRIKCGTNIPFIIGDDAASQTVVLTVRKENK